jgi:ParB/RepB/Spo0J family partition protein
MPKIEMPDVVLIPRALVRPNPWNPNEVAPELFNEIVSNIEELGFVQPIVVAPLDDGSEYKFQIIDGEHRYDALMLFSEEEVAEIPCIIRDMDVDSMKFQTVKLNKLRGKLNIRKFNTLVQDLMERHSFEEVAERMAFTDPTELEELLINARESLPTSEMKEEFDKAKEDIKTVEDLSLLLNRLFTQFGDTLPGNFMVLDFGGKNHIWVRMREGDYRNVMAKAREAMLEGYTFDSVLMHMLVIIPVHTFIEKYSDLLEEVPDEQGTEGTVIIDDGESE